ncbi:hypothetical protein ACIPL1_25855 [Pseudomonas sp. NPDC090202]|uniref:hypothetical protein n=1 Tax=unclassified Pseudomonas TaxID=196821 RepID=UPI00381E1933
MNAREANQIAKRYEQQADAFDKLDALLTPFFLRTSLADCMAEISECVSEAWEANIQCGWLSDYGDFDELGALVAQIRRDGAGKRFKSLQDIPEHLRDEFDDNDEDFNAFANELREECRDGFDSLCEQQEMLEEQFELAGFDDVFAFDEDSQDAETTRVINQVFNHLHTLWVDYEKLARSLVGMAHHLDDPDPDLGLTKALMFD